MPSQKTHEYSNNILIGHAILLSLTSSSIGGTVSSCDDNMNQVRSVLGIRKTTGNIHPP